MSEQTFAMPTKSLPMTFHFKKIVESKKPDEFAIMLQAAQDFPHVAVEIVETKDAAGNVVDRTAKRVSETHTVLVPNFEELLAGVCFDEDGNLAVEGVTAKEFKRLQEDVEGTVFAYAKTLVDGTAAQDEEGSAIKLADGRYSLEGFKVPSAENCSYAIIAAIEKVRAASGAGGKVTIPTAVRDAAIASLLEFLAAQGVPENGQALYGKLAKSYYSRNVAASLQPEAIELTAKRIAAWFADLDEDDKETYGLFHARVQAKAQEILKPEEIDMAIL